MTGNFMQHTLTQPYRTLAFLLSVKTTLPYLVSISSVFHCPVSEGPAETVEPRTRDVNKWQRQ